MVERDDDSREVRELLRELEQLRERLHAFVGREYRPERLQEARDLSDRLDALVVRYTRLTEQRRPAEGADGRTG